MNARDNPHTAQGEREANAPARLEDMQDFARQLQGDPDAARAFFESAGILDADGELAPQYRAR